MNRIRTWLYGYVAKLTFQPFHIPANSYVHVCDRCGALIGSTVTHKRRGC